MHNSSKEVIIIELSAVTHWQLSIIRNDNESISPSFFYRLDLIEQSAA
jgi:hypothetical protein